jgi:hypothetical protein
MPRLARLAAAALCLLAFHGLPTATANKAEQHAAFELVRPASTSHGIEKLKELISRDRGEVINARDKADHTPLNMAAFWGNPEAGGCIT